MKKYFAAVLFYITTILIIHKNTSIPIFGVNVNLSPQGYSLKIISIILIFLFIFWTIEEIKANNIIHSGRLLFLKYFREYIKSSKHGAKVSNLMETYDSNQILQNKDLYYIDGTLVLKTTNIFENDKYKPEGFLLNVGRIKFCWLFISNVFKTILSFKVFPYVGLLLWSLGIIIIFLFQLTMHVRTLL